MVWALDLGTTNSAITRWDDVSQRPRLLELPDICRKAGGEDHLEAPRLVPSAVHVIGDLDWRSRLASWPLLARHVLWGRQGWIGRQALDRNDGEPKPAYARSFKPHLGHSPFRILARDGRRTFTTRDVTRIFLRELLAEVKRNTGERIRELVVTAPVESFESYRAELVQTLRRLGVSRVRFLDEPVAAALGYGLGLKQSRLVLVVDFGGGTLDLALVSLSAKAVQEGHCEVLAKEGRAIGGDTVDHWLLQEFCERLEFPLSEDAADDTAAFWYRQMLAEARRVKERVFFNDPQTFYLTPPEELRRFEARLRGDAPELSVSKDMLAEILDKNGLYEALDACVEGIARQARTQNLSLDDVEDVLLVGGSTLLPRVYPLFEERFGRGRVRAFQPFEAVAYGAAAFAADAFNQSDFIVHDYAFLTYDRDTHDPQYTVIVPRGTRFPTAPDFWRRRLVPTCSLGEPETLFKLVICELGRALEGERRFAWDARGDLHKLGGAGGDTVLAVPLNEANPTLGYLKPPHPPGDKAPRLEITFGINAERWLNATVTDLKSGKLLLREESVVKLL